MIRFIYQMCIVLVLLFSWKVTFSQDSVIELDLKGGAQPKFVNKVASIVAANVSNGNEKNSTLTDGIVINKVGVDKHLLVQATYFDDTKDPVAVFVTLKNDNVPLSTYLAGVLENTESRPFKKGVSITLYGPQYYEGQRSLKMSITLVRLRKETFAKLRNRFDSYKSSALTLIPAIGQIANYASLGFDILQQELGKDKSYLLDDVVIQRYEQLNASGQIVQSASARGQWYIVGTGTVMNGLRSKASSSFDSAMVSGRPFPLINENIFSGDKKGRFLVIGLYPEEPNTDFAQLRTLLQSIFNSQADRLGDSTIRPDELKTDEATLQDVIIRQKLYAYKTRIEVLEAVDSDTKSAIKSLMRELNTISNPSEIAIVPDKLSRASEMRVARAINGIFEYRVDGSVIDGTGNGFDRIQDWLNWLDKRDSGETLTWRRVESNANKFASASDLYVKAKIDAVVSEALSDSTPPTSLKEMKKAIDALKKLQEIFDDRNEKYMLYEKKAAALYINQKFTFDLPRVVLGQFSEEDVRSYSKALENKLANIRIVEKDGVSGKWKATEVDEFVVSNYVKSLNLAIGTEKPLDFDHHKKARDLFKAEITDKFNDLTAAEDIKVKAKLDGLFAEQSLLDGKLFSTKGADYVWNNFILRVVTAGDGVRFLTERSRLPTTIQFYETVYRTNGDSIATVPGSASVAERQKLEELKQPILSAKRLSEISQAFLVNGQSLAERQLAYTFISENVPLIAETDGLNTLPTTKVMAQAWAANFNKQVPKLKFVDGKFMVTYDQDENAEMDYIKSQFDAATDVTEPPEFRNLLSTLIAYRFRTSGATALQTETRDRAIKILSAYTVRPTQYTNAAGLVLQEKDRAYWDLFQAETSLMWGSCKKIEVRDKSPCPNP